MGGSAIFFDIGDTLASPVIEEGILRQLQVYPFVPDILRRFRLAGGSSAEVALGIISNTGDLSAAMMEELLIKSGLKSLLDPGLSLFSSVEGLDKSQPAFFALAKDRAGLPTSQCVFVGEDAVERSVAASVGFRVSPHPLHALHLLESDYVIAT